jgi:hypothetical protein
MIPPSRFGEVGYQEMGDLLLFRDKDFAFTNVVCC